MLNSLIIAVLCFTGVRLAIGTASDDQNEEMRDELNLLIRRVNNLEEALKEKDDEIIGLGTANKELQEKIEEVQNPPFGYFCAFKDQFSTGNSVITYDKLLYSSQFGLQGDSPGINIISGKFLSGFTGTWRVDFSLWTGPDPAEAIYVFLYKNGVRVPETEFASYRSFTGSGYDGNTGGRSVLVHLDLGDELYIGTTTMEEPAVNIIFCVSLEQVDIQKHLL